MKKIFIILLSVLFIISCGKKYDSNSEFGAYIFQIWRQIETLWNLPQILF